MFKLYYNGHPMSHTLSNQPDARTLMNKIAMERYTTLSHVHPALTLKLTKDSALIKNTTKTIIHIEIKEEQ